MEMAAKFKMAIMFFKKSHFCSRTPRSRDNRVLSFFQNFMFLMCKGRSRDNRVLSFFQSFMFLMCKGIWRIVLCT
jgi:hypothetical protein